MAVTEPGYQPRHYSPASIIGASARSRSGMTDRPPPFPARPPVPLTAGDRAAIAEALADGASGVCRICGGIHVHINAPACPRLAAFELNGDGTIRSGVLHPDGWWDTSRVQWPEEAGEPAEGAPDA